MNYSYTDQNLIELPCSYMYADIYRTGFMESYVSDRIHSIGVVDSVQNIIKSESVLVSAMNLIAEYLDEMQPRIQVDSVVGLVEDLQHEHKCNDVYSKNRLIDTLKFPDIHNEINVSSLLQVCLSKVCLAEDMNEVKVWADRLVQRFEVTKKIYEVYPAGFRKGEGCNDSLPIYMKFSLFLAIYYIRTRQIKYLNTILKVSDLVCSVSDNNAELSILMLNVKQHVLLAELVNILDFMYRKEILLDIK